MARGGCPGVVLGDDVEDNVAVGRVDVMTVLAPAARAYVKLDVTAEKVSICFDDGIAVVGTGRPAGNPGEDDAEAATIFEAQITR